MRQGNVRERERERESNKANMPLYSKQKGKKKWKSNLIIICEQCY